MNRTERREKAFTSNRSNRKTSTKAKKTIRQNADAKRAARQKTKEVIAELDGQFCDYPLCADENAALVCCDRPAWQKLPSRLGPGMPPRAQRMWVCPLHYAPTREEFDRIVKREMRKYAEVEDQSRAVILALRDQGIFPPRPLTARERRKIEAEIRKLKQRREQA
jgi:hypothetical protein